MVRPVSISLMPTLRGVGILSCVLLTSAPVVGEDFFEIKPFGRTSFTWMNGGSEDDDIQFDEFEFDSIELGSNFDFKNKMRFRIHTSIRDDEIAIKDAYLQVPVGDVRVRFGSARVPNFFNWHVSGASKSFIERPNLRRAFGASRQFGIHLSSRGDNWGWMGGVFKGDINESVTTSDWTFAARAYRTFQSDETIYWLGASARYRTDAPEGFRYSDRPYSSAADRLVRYEGGTSDALVAGEFSFTHGALYGTAEAAVLRAKSGVEQGRSDGLFSGYVEFGYNLSGEAVKFDYRRGSFARASVDNPVFEGGLGLWQVSARYDVLDLRAGNEQQGTLNGGLQKSVVAALNWQPSSHIRIVTNISSSKVSHIAGSDERITAFGMRLFFLL